MHLLYLFRERLKAVVLLHTFFLQSSCIGCDIHDFIDSAVPAHASCTSRYLQVFYGSALWVNGIICVPSALHVLSSAQTLHVL